MSNDDVPTTQADIDSGQLFKNSDGYIPLNLNLEAYYESVFDALPDELKKRVAMAMPRHWDDIDVANRRSFARQHDYQHDPMHEPATYFSLYSFSVELKDWIAEAKNKSKDSVVLSLLAVSEKVEAILEIDRKRVGEDMQNLRQVALEKVTIEANEVKPLSTRTENNYLRLLYAFATSVKGFDATNPNGSAKLIIEELGITFVKQQTISDYIQKAHELECKERG